MKRIFLCLAFIAVTVAMSAAEITLNGVLYYATSDTTMQVYEVDDLLESVEVLPCVTYKDKVYTVNKIKEWAFQNCDLLTNVKLPETIKYIGYSAFSGCTDLVSINIPHHIKWIEGAAFSGCSSLTSITIPAGIKNISNGLFGGCKSLKNVHLPIGLTSIGEGAFKDCKSLASIDIPESVTEIGYDAFKGCSSLVSVKIPNQITQLHWRLFEGCASLVSVKLPNTLTYIGHHVFAGCKSLESIHIPDSVTEIDNSAFQLCTSLKEITIPYGVRKLGVELFDSCVSLVKVELPASIKSISDNMFSNCTDLESLVLPKTVNEIGYNSFENCYSLKHLVLPKRLTTMGYGALSKCSALTSLIYEGTKEQWAAVQHEDFGYYYVQVLHCSDGDIEIEEYKIFKARLSDGLPIHRRVPEVPCPFSVSESKQVSFSPGNLQYHPLKKEWRFALCQTDYAGETNERKSERYNGWIDCFAWGTGNDPVKKHSYGVKYETFVDWGVNKIGNDAPNAWRTLTKDEWNYLLNHRDNAANLISAAQVDGVNGIVLLPDNWVCPEGASFKPGFYFTFDQSGYAIQQTITAEQWGLMEAAGAVFLPAGGADSMGAQVSGDYWSATAGTSNYFGNEYSYYLTFNTGYAGLKSYERYGCYLVRLVKDL